MFAKLGGILIVGGLVMGLAASPAFAASGQAQEETALQNSRTTLVQAIGTAEQQTGGKACDAGVDVDHGKPRIVVETNGPNGIRTVTIDADSGQVVGNHAGGEPD